MKINSSKTIVCLTISILSISTAIAQKLQIKNKELGFNIIGNLEGLPNKSIIYLVHFEPGKSKVDTVDKCEVKDGKFTFKGSVAHQAQCYAIKLPDILSRKPSSAFVLVNGKVLITSSMTIWPNLRVSGSEANDEYLETRNMIEKLNNDIMDSRKSYSDSTSQINKSITPPERIKDSIVTKYIESHLNSLYIARVIITMSSDFGYLKMKQLYEKLTPRAKASYFGQELVKELTWEKKKELVKKGRIIPEFYVTSPLGEKISILDVASKARYTLIDFWASWCAPCRAEIPNMKKTYDAFHSKGFNIIGISTDKKEGDWRKALAEDNSPWIHGIDNIDRAGSNIFSIKGIPAFILINQRGEIISSDIVSSTASQFFEGALRGDDLYKKIEEL
ncbi:MAG TPA: TlpA disulfide reductase family protein, partial [Pedobacter sp.]|uniref:TlpA disulfide reductase family protein n=1 Tax=Pedobacter sp. TaxID=1411316 RepID=UPI002C97F6AD